MVFVHFLLSQKKFVCKGNTKHRPKVLALANIITNLFVRIPHNGFPLAFFVTSSMFLTRNYLVHPDPFIQRLLSHFLTGCPPLLIVRLAAKSLWLQVCHTFCIAENGNKKSAKPLCFQHRSFPFTKASFSSSTKASTRGASPVPFSTLPLFR
jgi:hypothetical protein